jgi:3'-phosphoadenosine 5'-phosphosulfate sulfotransferase (PAPS reductase)/FAD synthetase
MKMCNAIEEVKRLVNQFDGSAAFVINHSGGKDSTRMLGYVRNKFPEMPMYAVMADTGFEHQYPVSAADFARTRCDEFNVELTVVRNSHRNYLQMVEQRGMFPYAQFRQCTSDLKRGPIEKFIRSLPHRLIFNCIGIRSEESPPCSKLQTLSRNPSLTMRTRTVYNWLPIFDRTLAVVLAWHWVHAVRLHPVYVPEYHKDSTTGGYLHRLSCRLCVFSTDSDRLAIRRHDPEAFQAVSDFTMRSTGNLVQIADAARAAIEARNAQVCLPF